ncbi:hypothetical protein U9M48_021825 [Paspalum notatum var. saurae]|uniref:Uncharacterized protein n=1 Tax=Paspalum notatum var. saurae TaxID=547442 RepID=A0AAQ3THI0_PASNO
MACINMYNPDGAAGFGGGPQAPAAAALGPRISFSSDFAVEPAPAVQNRAMSLRCQDQEDLNFEFSVGSRPMMAADQLFSKGRILPLKDNAASFAARPPTTLRDELRGGGGGDDNDRAAAAAAAKGSNRWKEMLGLRKALCVGGPGKKVTTTSSGDKGGTTDAAADMVAPDDMAASNQICEVRRLYRVTTSDGATLWGWINSALLCLLAPLDDYIKRDKGLRAQWRSEERKQADRSCGLPCHCIAW